MLTSGPGIWMLASAGFAALVAVAAWGADWLMTSLHRPRRHVWSTALAVSVLWPLVAWLVLSSEAFPSTTMPLNALTSLPLPATDSLPDAARSVSPPIAWGTALLVVWGLLSFLLIVNAWLAYRALRAACRSARPQDMLGVPVLRTRTLGPAVFGLSRTTVVMPEWTWDLDVALQRLVLQHELEHRAAGDPWLVWGAVLATVAMPWNPSVWWMTRRLRLAMEIDCDERTRRHVPDAAPLYARLLLLMAHQRQQARVALMLIPTTSQLSRRLDAMTTPPSSSPVRRVLVGLTVMLAVTAACSRPISNAMAGPPTPMVSATSPADAAIVSEGAAPNPASPANVPSGKPYFDFQTEKPASLLTESGLPQYPAELRSQSVTGVTLVQFVVDSLGHIELPSFKVLRADQAVFADAVRAALPTMRFSPATVAGRGVRQLVQMPFAFELSGSVTNQVRAARVQQAPATQPPRSEAEKALFAGKTEQSAKMLPDSPGPVYPAALRSQGITGTVLAQFIVDSSGRVVPQSLRVLQSTHEEFTRAVRDAMPTLRFSPARVNGVAVKQLLQEPFSFRLDR